eukprot:15338205-Ditylum_brightwellii.AAC.1
MSSVDGKNEIKHDAEDKMKRNEDGDDCEKEIVTLEIENTKQRNTNAIFDVLIEQVVEATNALNDHNKRQSNVNKAKNLSSPPSPWKITLTIWFFAGSGVSFLLGVGANALQLLQARTLRKLFCPPFSTIDKFAWSVKFALGFTALVSIAVFEDIFSGWLVVAYSFSITLTSEGAVKKGLFRIFGVALGGFSAYLALTAS